MVAGGAVLLRNGGRARTGPVSASKPFLPPVLMLSDNSHYVKYWICSKPSSVSVLAHTVPFSSLARGPHTLHVVCPPPLACSAGRVKVAVLGVSSSSRAGRAVECWPSHPKCPVNKDKRLFLTLPPTISEDPSGLTDLLRSQ